MIVTTWKGGSSLHDKPAGYGFKVKIKDRDTYFDKDWKTVFLHLEGVVEPVKVIIDKPSFWNNTCHELISKNIGKWLLDNFFAPWPSGRPPKFDLVPITNNHFKVLKCCKEQTANTISPGYINKNDQKNMGMKRPISAGSDHNQYVYIINCTKCGYVYGANGSDIFERKCPSCQGGKPGLKLNE